MELIHNSHSYFSKCLIFFTRGITYLFAVKGGDKWARGGCIPRCESGMIITIMLQYFLPSCERISYYIYLWPQSIFLCFNTINLSNTICWNWAIIRISHTSNFPWTSKPNPKLFSVGPPACGLLTPAKLDWLKRRLNYLLLIRIS